MSEALLSILALILHLCQDSDVEMSARNLFRVVQLRYV